MPLLERFKFERFIRIKVIWYTWRMRNIIKYPTIRTSDAAGS